MNDDGRTFETRLDILPILVRQPGLPRHGQPSQATGCSGNRGIALRLHHDAPLNGHSDRSTPPGNRHRNVTGPSVQARSRSKVHRSTELS